MPDDRGELWTHKAARAPQNLDKLAAIVQSFRVYRVDGVALHKPQRVKNALNSTQHGAAASPP